MVTRSHLEALRELSSVTRAVPVAFTYPLSEDLNTLTAQDFPDVIGYTEAVYVDRTGYD